MNELVNVALAVVAFRLGDVVLSADLAAVVRQIVLLAAVERVVVGAVQESTYFVGVMDCPLQQDQPNDDVVEMSPMAVANYYQDACTGVAVSSVAVVDKVQLDS